MLEGFNEQRDGLTKSVSKFDVTQSTWSEVAPMPEPRFMMAVCAIGNTIYVFGGAHRLGGSVVSVIQYDTVANVWNVLDTTLEERVVLNVTEIDGLIHISVIGNSTERSSTSSRCL
jgi:N-acetylneuraminic acid mutarotase